MVYKLKTGGASPCMAHHWMVFFLGNIPRERASCDGRRVAQSPSSPAPPPGCRHAMRRSTAGGVR